MSAEKKISDPAPLDADLRSFLDRLTEKNLLLRVPQEVDPHLEMTELCHRLLLQGGPAVLFENPKGHSMPVLANLFGTPQRIVMALGREQVSDLRQIGQWLAELRQPQPPGSLKEVLRHWPLLRRVLQMRPKEISNPPCQQVVWEGADVDLGRLPIQTCWPEDAGPLITWGLTITRGPRRQRLNIGIYRQQVIGPNRVIMRWLAQRGGALDYADHHAASPQEPFPVAVVLGADPATTLAAVTPVPDSLSEFQFAGLLRGVRSEIARCLSHDLVVPAHAEIVLEGHIHPGDTALEGPFGDHTGYYNEAERYPVLTITRMTMRRQPLYHSTYTGKPPDEPSVLGAALNEVFIPLLQQTFPEIVDFYLPPEGCSYRFACVSIRKEYPGHAKRVMFGIWSVLRQFLYTKFILVTDDDVNVRSWPDVIWALTTRVDARRDVMVVDDTPMDALDFSSPQAGLSAKMGIDATNKWPGEASRAWGRIIVQDKRISTRVDDLWRSLGLG